MGKVKMFVTSTVFALVGVLSLAMMPSTSNALKLKQRVAKTYIDKDGRQLTPIEANRLALSTGEVVLECTQMEMEGDEYTGKLKLRKVK